MAKFSSSRSKTARNPGPVGRVKTFNQSKTRAGGFRGGNPRRRDEEEERFDRRPRRRGPSDSMNFDEATDYVRLEAPGRPKDRSGSRPTKHFNPLNYLRADEEDGVVNIPSPRFVEPDDDERIERGGERVESPFRKSVRGTKAAGKFTKDFRDAKSPRKGTASGTRKPFGTPKPTGDRKPFGQKPRVKKAAPKGPAPEGERLQKVLAASGFGSRRDCEEFIIAGRVMVDREIVTELGTRVLPSQTIHLDGELVRRPKKFVYYALNKPSNVICTNDDPDGRRRALDYIHENVPGLFPVGRLDLHSEGLLLITNDGELANRLTHPSYEVPKIYRVRVSGTPTREEIAQICRGVHLAEGLAKADEVKLRHVYRDGTAILEVTLREGRNREIRRILARIGHNVLDLVRISIADVKLGKMPTGAYRPLTSQEVKSLKALVGLTGAKSEILASSEPVKPAKPKQKPKDEAPVPVQAQEEIPVEENYSPDALYEEWKAEF